MRENELETKFRNLIAKSGGKAYKFVSPGNDGVPDRLVVLPGGRIGFVELKKKGEKPRKQQQHRMRELEDLGCFTAVVDDMESAVFMLGSLMAQNRTAEDTFSELVNRAPHRRNL